MTALNQSQPRAEGDLSKTPFAHLLLYLQRESLNGTLVIERGGYETKVLFRNGRAVAARPIPRGAGLQDGLLELCGLVEATYSFWDGDLVGESDGSGEASGVIRGTVDAHSFVAESLRAHAREAVMAAVVDRYRGVHLRLLPEADLRRLGLRGVEARLVERLRSVPRLTEDFIERSEVPPADARKLVYLLLITRYVQPLSGDSSGGSGVRSTVQTVPPGFAGGARSSVTPTKGTPVPSRPPTPTRGTSLPPSYAPPYSAPPAGQSSRPPSATPRPSHPPATELPPDQRTDRPPSHSPMPAWQQLAMRPSSRPSMPSVSPPSMAPPPVEHLDPSGKLKRAEQLAAGRNFQEAERIVDDLIANDSSNADYLAMRAFLLYQQFSGERPPRALVDAIERSLRLNEEQARALYVKGMVLQRMGKRNEALRYFTRALDSDPHHLEAQREIRLAKMRRDR